jgi:hypothetical protein
VSLLWVKRGWLTPGSQTIRALERFGASDVWDFVDNSYMRAGVVTTNAGLTVTRASSGYAETSDGRLVSFGSGVLRRTDRGVLVEGARTNLLLRSQEFNAASWPKVALSVTANAATAPDGTATADELVSSGSASSYIRQNVTVAATTAHAISVYMKAAVNSWVLFEIWNAGVTKWSGRYVNLATGALGSATSGGGGLGATFSTQALDNGWFRVNVNLTSDNTTLIPVIYIANGDLDIAVSNLASILIWGAQLELGSFPSSYVFTEGSTAMRAADEVTANLTGAAYPLSLYAEFVRNGDTGAAEGVFQIDASARAQRANINVSSSDTLSVTARGGTNDGDATVTGAISVGAITKGASRIAVDNVQAARAGALATADTTASVPTAAPDTVRFGDFGSAATYGFFYIRRAAIFPTALTDAQLQGITT